MLRSVFSLTSAPAAALALSLLSSAALADHTHATRAPQGAAAPEVLAEAAPAPPAAAGGRFFFDVANRSADEVLAVLERAEQLTRSRAPEDPLDMVMVLHGPDLKLFTREAHDAGSQITGIAERLEAMGTIDFKVCMRSAQAQRLGPEDFPAFIELVPGAPAELRRLEAEGYIEL